MTLTLIALMKSSSQIAHPQTPTSRTPSFVFVPLFRNPSKRGIAKSRVLCVLPRPALIFVTPNGFTENHGKAIHLAKSALAGGASLVQIRDRRCPAVQIQKAVHDLLHSGIPANRLSVNGLTPKEVQSISKSLGLHIREADISEILPIAIETLAEDAIVSCSVHSVQSAQLAHVICQPSYIQVGTMFPTNSHPGKQPEGPSLLSAVREQVGPHQMLIGIGGISEENLDAVFDHGGDGIAVISSISAAKNPLNATSRLATLCRISYAESRKNSNRAFDNPIR